MPFFYFLVIGLISPGRDPSFKRTTHVLGRAIGLARVGLRVKWLVRNDTPHYLHTAPLDGWRPVRPNVEVVCLSVSFVYRLSEDGPGGSPWEGALYRRSPDGHWGPLSSAEYSLGGRSLFFPLTRVCLRRILCTRAWRRRAEMLVLRCRRLRAAVWAGDLGSSNAGP